MPKSKRTRHDNLKLKIVRATKNAIIPTCATEGSAGYDLYSVENIVIPAGARTKVSIGWRISIPSTYYLEIKPRSSLALLESIDAVAGVIDSDYRGIVHVVIANNGKDGYTVSEGQKIAQMIIRRCYKADITEVDVGILHIFFLFYYSLIYKN